MKKNAFTFAVFLILGLAAGGIATQLLSDVDSLSFLTKSVELSWRPRADLQIVQYDLSILVRLNMVNILCVAAAIWIYRKWKP